MRSFWRQNLTEVRFTGLENIAEDVASLSEIKCSCSVSNRSTKCVREFEKRGSHNPKIHEDRGPHSALGEKERGEGESLMNSLDII